MKISQNVADPLLADSEALLGLLLCECRLVYQNKTAWEFIKTKLPSFKENHQKLKARIQDQKVKEAVNDILLMIYDD